MPKPLNERQLLELERAAALMRTVRPVHFAIASLLFLSGCSASGLAICTSAGGTYAAGTCTGSTSAEQQAVEQQCEARGGVYLGGQGICLVSAGGGLDDADEDFLKSAVS